MNPSNENDFEPPQTVGSPKPVDGFVGMRYVDAYRYVFDSPRWAMNLLLATVCHLIPLVGPLVLMGYQFEVIESLHRNRKGTYPDFDFNHFVDYLMRGLWPFLVSLVVGLVVTIPLLILFYGGMAVVVVAMAAVGEDAAPVVAVVGFPLLFILVMAASVAIGLICIPMFLRAGLAQDFGQAFKVDFIKQFVVGIWREMILGTLFLMISAFAVSLIGMLLCCIGMYPAVTLVMLAQAHMYYQFYECHLARGGEPIPLKTEGAV